MNGLIQDGVLEHVRFCFTTIPTIFKCRRESFVAALLGCRALRCSPRLAALTSTGGSALLRSFKNELDEKNGDLFERLFGPVSAEQFACPFEDTLFHLHEVQSLYRQTF